MLDLSLSNEEDEEVTIQIYNSIGQLVHEENTASVNGMVNKEIQLTGAPGGLYMVSVTAGEELFTRQLLIQE